MYYIYIYIYICIFIYTHIYIYIYISEAWGEKRAPALPKTGNCFALLACMHARTHAHTELTGRASQKIPRSVRLSVPRPPLSRVFAVFLDLLVDAHRFFDECLEDFA